MLVVGSLPPVSSYFLVTRAAGNKSSCSVGNGNFAPSSFTQLDLWKTSGHYDFYRESMFNQMEIDTEEYQARESSLVTKRKQQVAHVLRVF